jgi:hypothetical protein
MSGTNWTLPLITDTYTSVLSELMSRDVSAATQFNSGMTADTNIPTNAIQWNVTNNNWSLWNGSAWVALTAIYGISISGNAATASAVAWGGITAKPTTVAGYGITDINSVYAPTLTGTGASGTWGISITGSAAQLGGVAAASYALLTSTVANASALGGTAAASYALLNSPTFTGTPSLPTGTTGVTQTAGNNTTALATTAFVTTAVASGTGTLLTGSALAIGTQTLAHGLGRLPKFVTWRLVVNTANNNWSVGDEIYFTGTISGVSEVQMTIGADATNVVFNNADSTLALLNKTTHAYASVSVAYFTLKVLVN